MSARLREIETALVEEFELDGFEVVKDVGEYVALIETLRTEGLREFTRINLSRLAEQIAARFP